MYAPVTKDIAIAKKVIQEGRIVAFPTGTSYGLAGDALQGHALQRLRNLKQRPKEKSFTVFLRPELWDKYFEMTSEERALLEKYPNSPLTVLLQPKESLAHLAQDGRVGLRVIDHPMMAELASSVDVPLTATSANVSGQEACVDVQCIQGQFPGKLPATGDIARAKETTYDLSLGCILDGGPLPAGRVSTIVRLDNGAVQVIRAGTLSLK